MSILLLAKSEQCVMIPIGFLGGGGLINFIKEHAALISNIAVVLVVLAAIYVKATDEGSAVLFKKGDAYIIIGAFLALAVLRIVAKRQKQNKK